MEKNSRGRPKENNPKAIKLCTNLTQEENALIEELINEMGISKAKFLRCLLFGEIDDVKVLEHINAFPIIKRYKEIASKFSEEN